MKRGNRGVMLPRRFRALRRNALFSLSRLPQLAIGAGTWLFAFSLVMWRRFGWRLVVALAVVLAGKLLLVSTHPSRASTRPAASEPSTRHLGSDRPAGSEPHAGAFAKMPHFRPQPRDVLSGFELFSLNETMLACRVHEVCLDRGDGNTTRVQLPKQLAPQKGLLDRCGFRLDYEFSISQAVGKMSDSDFVVGGDSAAPDRAISAEVGLWYSKICNSTNDGLSYECYTANKQEACLCPLGKQLNQRPLQEVLANTGINRKGSNGGSPVCYRSMVTVCGAGKGAPSGLPPCGAEGSSVLGKLPLNELLKVAAAASSRLQQTVREYGEGENSADDGPGAESAPAKREFIEMASIGGKLVSCRIGPACRDATGVLILPKWMRKQEKELKTCGLKGQIAYELSDAEPVRQADLFGVELPRSSPGAFLEKFLGVVVALESRRGQRAATLPTTRMCIQEDGRRLCRNESATFEAEVLLPDVNKDGEAGSWIAQLVQALPPEPSGPKPQYVSSINQSRQTCLASIVSGMATKSTVETLLDSESTLFRRLNIRREPSLGTARSDCELRVTILDYQDLKPVANGVRPIGNVKSLQGAIRSATQVPYCTQLNLALRMTSVNPRKKSFREMVDVMSSTDVLIGSHGDDLANLIFLRRNSVVIEAAPFGYAAGPYGDLAELLGLQHHRVMGAPDATAFAECVASKVAFGVLKRSDADRIIADFQKAASNGEALLLPEGAFMAEMRKCMISQRVELAVDSVANLTVTLGSHGCTAPD